jgi:uncharacterized Zn-finger protein
MVYVCPFPECSKQLCSKYNLRRHVENHHKRIRRFECEICFKKFSSAQNLKEHSFLHITRVEEPLEQPCEVETPEIQIPKLTDLLMTSSDLRLRPYLKINRLYLFPPLN